MNVTRSDILQEAERIVNQDRNLDYSAPEDNFKDIAELQSIYLRHRPSPLVLQPHDIAVLNMLQKIARLMTSPTKKDHWVDVAGYAACGGSLMVEVGQEPTPEAVSAPEAPQQALGILQPVSEIPQSEAFGVMAPVPDEGEIYFHPKTGNTYEVDRVRDDGDGEGTIWYRNVETGKRYHKAFQDWRLPRENGDWKYQRIMSTRAAANLKHQPKGVL